MSYPLKPAFLQDSPFGGSLVRRVMKSVKEEKKNFGGTFPEFLRHLLLRCGVSHEYLYKIQNIFASESGSRAANEILSLIEESALLFSFIGKTRVRYFISLFAFVTKFLRILIFCLSLQTTINKVSLTVAGTFIKDVFGVEVDESECHPDIVAYRSSDNAIINRPLFRKNFHNVVNILSIHHATFVNSLGEAEHDAWVSTTESVSFALVFEFEGRTFLMLDKGKNFAFYTDHSGISHEYWEDMFAKFNANTIDLMQHSLIKITEHKCYGDPIIVSEDLPDIKLWDRDLYNYLHTAIYNSLKLGMKTGILLYGRPGVSKTSTTLKVLKEIEGIKVRISEVGYGLAKSLLENTKTSRIVIVDDCDITENKEKNEMVADLLNFLDSNCYEIVIMILNKLTVDPAIIRSGRIDLKRFCKEPDFEHRVDIVSNIYREMQVFRDFSKENSPEFWGEVMDHMTHAEIHTVFKNAVRYEISVKESLEKFKEMNIVMEEYKEEIADEA